MRANNNVSEKVKNRRKNGIYYTPKEVEALAHLSSLRIPKVDVLWDPCCGDGRLLRAWDPETSMVRFGTDIIVPSCDVDGFRQEDVYKNIHPMWQQADAAHAMILTNPPYTFQTGPEELRAVDMVDRLLAYARASRAPRWTVACLLRLSFLEPVTARRGLDGALANVKKIGVLQRRSYTGGPCDNVTSAWVVWDNYTTEKRIEIEHCVLPDGVDFLVSENAIMPK